MIDHIVTTNERFWCRGIIISDYYLLYGIQKVHGAQKAAQKYFHYCKQMTTLCEESFRKDCYLKGAGITEIHHRKKENSEMHVCFQYQKGP